MATLFVRHDVKDFKTWKSAYDAFNAERQAMGVTGHGVYQTDGIPNNVTIYHHFDNISAAREFAGSARLKEVMENGGVIGAPEIWFTQQA